MNGSLIPFFITIIESNTDFQCHDHFVDICNIAVMDA